MGIDGIEGFTGCMTRGHDHAYNRMGIGEAIKTPRGLDTASYPLVLVVDILEHFAPADGRAFLTECRQVVARCELMATPSEFIVQEVEANPLKDHHSVWSERDLAALGSTIS